ncbi:uncharacterized protein LOC120353175 [Nilaparvata lugens]|uniref:uncharacterized protein LOC120353175 n=1 Tax=Nilaparvata lugens TaxID=108931 RepID=UPI00193DB9EC|nr:uncharacterized protein LOC120353175 [Nilaparvata lugens]
MIVLAVLTLGLLVVASVTTAKTIFECTPESKTALNLPFFLCTEVNVTRNLRENVARKRTIPVRIFVQALQPESLDETLRRQTSQPEQALKKQKKLIRKKRVTKRRPGYPYGGGGFGGGFSMAQANSFAVGGGTGPFGGGGGGAIATANANALSYGRR